MSFSLTTRMPADGVPNIHSFHREQEMTVTTSSDTDRSRGPADLAALLKHRTGALEPAAKQAARDTDGRRPDVRGALANAPLTSGPGMGDLGPRGGEASARLPL
ncbi:Hypothetical predicted protein [Marmota monax]|uniref:Uncharacterized protein n=1 Tax=Marmota monax TaxID=9995 RepID=A0A5E4CCQ0_MARMO|nr:Hypothetical predicted protein [Marmota monax]